MALPTLIPNSAVYPVVGSGNLGPYHNGTYTYVLGKWQGPTFEEVGIWRSTDPTSSFTRTGTNVAVAPSSSTSNIAYIDSYFYNDYIYVLYISRASGGTFDQIRMAQYNCANGGWVANSTSAPGTSGSTLLYNPTDNPTTYWGGITVRSDDDVIVVYPGENPTTMGGTYQQVAYSRWEGSGTGWTHGVVVANSGVKDQGYMYAYPVMGSSDQCHFGYTREDNGDFYLRALSSGNALRTQRTVATSLIDAAAPTQARGAGLNYTRSSSERIHFNFTNYNPTFTRMYSYVVSFAHFTDDSSPTFTTDQATQGSSGHNIPNSSRYTGIHVWDDNAIADPTKDVIKNYITGNTSGEIRFTTDGGSDTGWPLTSAGAVVYQAFDKDWNWIGTTNAQGWYEANAQVTWPATQMWLNDDGDNFVHAEYFDTTLTSGKPYVFSANRNYSNASLNNVLVGSTSGGSEYGTSARNSSGRSYIPFVPTTNVYFSITNISNTVPNTRYSNASLYIPIEGLSAQIYTRSGNRYVGYTYFANTDIHYNEIFLYDDSSVFGVDVTANTEVGNPALFSAANCTTIWDAQSFGRLNDAFSTTNWSGSTPTSEPDYFYQGNSCISVTVKTAVGTIAYTHTANVDMNTSPRVWLAKINQTNKDAIDGSGIQFRVGNSTAYTQYSTVFSAATYPKTGGFQIVPLAPTVAQWSTNTGSPNFTQVNYFYAESDGSALAKAPNLGLDAIDIMDIGTGLTLTRGDHGAANSDFNCYVLEDEGTIDNRWGVVTSRSGIVYVNGVLTIGNTSVPTSFFDSNKVLVFPDHRVTNGFCGININSPTLGSLIYTNTTFNSCVFNGKGDLYTNDDTRPDYNLTPVSGFVNVNSTTFDGFRQIVSSNVCVFNTCTFINGQRYNHAPQANLYQCTITEAKTGNGTAFVNTITTNTISQCIFNFSSNGGHAIEITSPGTYNMSNFFNGYGANASGNAAIYNNSGGLVTLNITGGDIPTIRDGTSASTNVVSSSKITITNMQTESEIRIIDTINNVIVDGTESVNGAVISASVAGGGSGYSVSDVLTVQGGTGSAAQLTVASVDSGAVTAVTVSAPGNYTVNPSNPVSVIGGGGTGATFNLNIRGSFEYTYGGTQTYDIVVFHLDYKDVRFVNYNFPASNSSLLISQVVDRVYSNP